MGPVEHIVADLVQHERCFELAQDRDRLFRRLRAVVGNPDVKRLAGAHELIQRQHRLLDRSIRVGTVMVEDIHVFQPHPLQALVAAGDQVLARTPFAVGAGPHQVARLAGDDQLVAERHQVLLQNPAEGDLRRTRFRAVVVREVEVGDAEVERGSRHRPAVVVHVDAPEVVPQPQRYRRKPQPAASAAAVGHGVVTVFSR